MCCRLSQQHWGGEGALLLAASDGAVVRHPLGVGQLDGGGGAGGGFGRAAAVVPVDAGTNCIKIDLPGKSILGDYTQYFL